MVLARIRLVSILVSSVMAARMEMHGIPPLHSNWWPSSPLSQFPDKRQESVGLNSHSNRGELMCA